MNLMIDKDIFMKTTKTVLILTLLILLSTQSIAAVSSNDPLVRIGDMTRIEGMRTNQLSGYGIVVGLNGSGDSASNQATVQSIANMLDEYGIEVSSDQVESQNVAAVIVTATLPAYAYSGDQIDVTVNSIGDADSLQGGTLLQTPLEAANGDIYAVAQGPVSIGGYNVQGGGGNSQRQNHPTVGKVPSGALVEREIEADLNRDQFTYILNQPNFTTARYMAQAINDQFEYLSESSKIAKASSPARVKVDVPSEYEDEPVNFISQINNLEVRSSMNAKVVINERTGTIVMGHNVRISTVSVAHGNLTVTISTTEEVSQPEPLSDGETEVTEETEIEVEEEEGHMTVVESKGTIQDLVTALNTIGATPRDIIAIIQQIKSAGALHAELEIE
ncbi:MAG: flagellar basal body P-ring protein FlgI [Bacillota bacterium]